MKSLFGGTTLALSMLAMLASACGGDDDGGTKSPTQLCNDEVVMTCARAFECLTPELRALAMIPETEAACVSQFKAAQACDSVTAANACEGSEVYHADQHQKCISQGKAASCSQILSSGGDLGTFAPACDEICTVP